MAFNYNFRYLEFLWDGEEEIGPALPQQQYLDFQIRETVNFKLLQ